MFHFLFPRIFSPLAFLRYILLLLERKNISAIYAFRIIDNLQLTVFLLYICVHIQTSNCRFARTEIPPGFKPYPSLGCSNIPPTASSNWSRLFYCKFATPVTWNRKIRLSLSLSGPTFFWSYALRILVSFIQLNLHYVSINL
jgi:hypothetical protein